MDDLYEECRKNELYSKKLVNKIMEKYQHFILADFLPFAVVLEDISRLAAVYLWRNVNVHNLIFGAGIETSFRVVKPNRYHESLGDFGRLAFEAYERAINVVPEQDARYMLPEGALTRMIFTCPPRYLGKLANALKDKPLKELEEISEKLEAIVKEKFDLEIEEKTPSDWNFWEDEKFSMEISPSIEFKGEPFTIFLSMGVRGSLSMFAQLVRQRQLLCNLEPLESIAKHGKFVIPPHFQRL